MKETASAGPAEIGGLIDHCSAAAATCAATIVARPPRALHRHKSRARAQNV